MNKRIKQFLPVLLGIPLLVSVFVLGDFVLNSESLLKTSPNTYAVAKTWDGGGDGISWDDAANWNPDGVPTSGDDVTINTTTTVYFPSKLGSGTYAYWPLDDNAANTTVTDAFSSYDGTLSTNTSSVTTTGTVNGAFDFNGTSDYITFGETGSTSTDVLTVMAWVQFDDLTGHQAIYTDGDATRGFEFGLYNNELAIGIENANSHRTIGYSTAGLSTGTWYHVMAVADGPNGDMFLYVNGSLVASNTALAAFIDYDSTGVGTYVGSTGSQSPSSNTSPGGSANFYFNGRIDDVRVFRTKGYAADATLAYNGGSGISSTQILPSNLTINSLTLGNAGGTTSPTLEFTYDSSGASNNLDVSGGNVIVYSNATITHSAGTSSVVARVDIECTSGDITVTGTVSGASKGYAIGQGPGAGGAGVGSGGGSYGGRGADGPVGSATDVYGSISAPIDLGSGGGAVGSNGLVGGGAIKLSATSGTITVNGAITVDGQSNTANNSGGGAGGSIYLLASTLAGTGTVTANGGSLTGNAGGGGGGRIAVYYDTLTLSDANIRAYGGSPSATTSSQYFGGAGTVYLKDNAVTNADLILDNNNKEGDTQNDYYLGRTPLTPTGTPLSITIDDFIIRNKAQWDMNSDTTLTYNTITWSSSGIIADNGGTALDGSTGGDPNDGILESGYSLTVPATAVLYANTAKTFSSITVNGRLTHSNNSTVSAGKLYEINLTSSGDITVASTGSIDANARGYFQTEGPGTGSGSGTPGGGYGGEGGSLPNGTGGTVYGSISAPVDLGSGAASSIGLRGGGAIKLTATSGTITANGIISANGQTTTANNNGGGSGGSVYIIASTVAGSSTITSNGGSFGANAAGGGGGRIAVYYDTLSIADTNIHAYGGVSSSSTATLYHGGAGTIYLKDNAATYPDIIIDNNDQEPTSTDDRYFGKTPLTPSGTPLSITVDTFTIRNKGYWDMNSDTTLSYSTFTWSDAGVLVDNGGDAYDLSTAGDPNDGVVQAGYDLTIPSTATLYANTAKTFTNITVNGRMTHSNNTTLSLGKVYEINLISSSDITISSTGTIDASDRGYEGSEGTGAGTDATNSGGGGYGGGGGDGTGSVGGGVYGSVTAPVDLGSGGGTSGGTALRGGGAIKLTATSGTISVTGDIFSDGQSITSTLPGGGSGGSIYLIASTISGSGTVHANGGAQTNNGSSGGGGGGGGRIAAYFDTLTLAGTSFHAYGGTSSNTNGKAYSGAAGTVYLKDNAATYGDVIIDNNNVEGDAYDDRFVGRTALTPSGTPLTLTVDQFIVRNKGQFELNSDTTLNYNTFSWSSSGIVVDSGGDAFDISTAGDPNDGVVQAGYPLSVPSTATYYANTAKTFSTISTDGRITHSNNTTSAAGKVYEINLTSSADISISSSGSIDADERGYIAGEGPGQGSDGNAGGGGGYGGNGGDGSLIAGGNIYGSLSAPTDLGSGSGLFVTGVRGAGAIKLTATSGTLTANGVISSDGQDALAANYGGGSGGSIYLIVGTLSGSSVIHANGGSQSSGTAGGGGGGRIAVYYDTLSLSNSNIYAYGGTSTSTATYSGGGGAGTVYLKDNAATNPDLILDNNSFAFANHDDRFFGKTPLTPSGTPASLTFDDIIIRNAANLDLNSDSTISYTTLTWTGGQISDNGGTMTDVTSGDLVIPSGALFLANTARSYTTVTNSGTIGHSQNTTSETYKVSLTTTGNFTVNSGGKIDVSYVGYTSASGPGAGADAGIYGSGAGHGGIGGDTTDAGVSGGSTYDSETSPVNIGSGGGNSGLNSGANGGGAVKLTVGGDLALNGNVLADARANAASTAGGGSGGAIWLAVTGALSGTGDLSANGSDASIANAGAGAGGRIRIECASGSWTGTTSVIPGSVGGTAGAGTVSSACTLNVSPTVDSVRVGSTANGSNVSPLALTANTTTTYYINGQVSDGDGYTDITDVDARLYRSGATGGVSCTSDKNDCYIQATCSLTGGSGNSVNYSCQVDLAYFTDPTDAGTYAADTWNVRVTVSDSVDTVNDDTYTNEVSTLTAISAPGNVAHGALSLGQKNDGVSLTIYNAGNVDVNIDVSMASAISCATGTIPIANNKYDLSNVSYDLMANTLSSTPTTLDVALPQQTNDAVQVSDDVYWGIEVPATGLVGACTGTLTITAN